MSSSDVMFTMAVLAGALRAGTPLVFAGLGELIYERSGVLNLGIEGLMLVGALSSVWAQVTWNCWPASLAFAVLCAGLYGALHGVLCAYLGTNQVATGLAMVILAQGATAVLGSGLVGQRIQVDLSVSMPLLSEIPYLGAALFQRDLLVYTAICLVFVVWFFLFHTRWGVALRAIGENAESAAALGLPVRATRLAASVACGGLCGLGGAHLALAYASQWQEDMVAGRGWIAIVLVIFSIWRPRLLLLAGFFFGGLTALQLNLQAWGIKASPYLLGIAPFLLAIGVLVVVSFLLRYRPIGMPADLGKTYVP